MFIGNTVRCRMRVRVETYKLQNVCMYVYRCECRFAFIQGDNVTSPGGPLSSPLNRKAGRKGFCKPSFSLPFFFLTSLAAGN
jgi:hypothetical protein